jgi:hypothetical protein
MEENVLENSIRKSNYKQQYNYNEKEKATVHNHGCEKIAENGSKQVETNPNRS